MTNLEKKRFDEVFNRLTQRGFEVNGLSLEDLLYIEAQCQHNHIKRGKREPKRSNIFQDKLNKEIQHKQDLQVFLRAIRNGENLNCYLTRKFKRDYVDWNYAMFGIHHFHIQKDGKRSDGDKLVFAKVTNNYVYLVDLLDHSYFEDINSCKPTLIEIIWSSWPRDRNQLLNNVIDKYTPMPMAGVEETLADYKNAYIKGVNQHMFFDGIPYAIRPFLRRTTYSKNDAKAIGNNITYADGILETL